MRRTLSAIFAMSLLCVLTVPSVFAWELERPSLYVRIDKKAGEGLESSTTDGKGAVGLGVHVEDYTENKPGWPSDGDDDVVQLKISAVANTRQIIMYSVQTDGYSWHDNLPNSLSLSDNVGTWISEMGFTARFYGGPNSGEYTGVWVSSNGFISFDSERTDPYYSYSIPNTMYPNAFIAPFWRDLKPNLGGSITYGLVWHSPTGTPPFKQCLAISWHNVPDKYGVQQSCQVLIENAPTVSGKLRQSRIWFQYKSIALNDQTTVGIEDQRGGKGVSYDYQLLQNETALKFEQNSNSALVGYLTIRLSENEANAHTRIEPHNVSLRGYNVELAQNVEDTGLTYALALEGASVLVLYALDLAGKSVATAGFIIGGVFIILDYAQYAARQQAIAKLLQTDDYNTYAKARARVDPDDLFISSAVDASFDITAYWVLTDPNNEDHALTVTAELTYYEYDGYGNTIATPSIQASKTLNLLRETEPKTIGIVPATIWGAVNTDDREDSFWYALGGYDLTQSIVLKPYADVDLALYLYKYSPGSGVIGDLIAQSDAGGAGQPESITEGPYSVIAEYRLVKIVHKSGSSQWYNLRIDVQSSYGPPPGGGGGGEPPWNMVN